MNRQLEIQLCSIVCNAAAPPLPRSEAPGVPHDSVDEAATATAGNIILDFVIVLDNTTSSEKYLTVTLLCRVITT